MRDLNGNGGQMPAKPSPARNTVTALNTLFRDEWIAYATSDDFRVRLQALHRRALAELPPERPS